jgi:DNA-binding MarR family transcriptional regulator
MVSVETNCKRAMAGKRSSRAEAQEGELRLERFLPYRLSVLANLVSRSLARVYEERFGLSVPQWRVIAVLARFPGLSANAVADKTAMDKVTVSRAVAGLLAQGRVERRLDSADRRRSALRLSRRGEAVYRAIAPVALSYERDLLRGLAAEEKATLDRLLGELSRRASA